MKSERTDLYKVLQVDPSANPLVIQAAYRALAQIHHPDVSGDAEEMKRLNAAWEVLGDPRRRRQYDIERAGRHAPQPGEWASGRGPGGSAADSPAQPPPAGGPSPSTTRHEARAGSPVGPASGSVIRFGRYDGWTIGQVARVDPPFLEWLRGAPLGRALGPEIDLALQRAAGARRMGIAGVGTTPPDGDRVHSWPPGAPTRIR